MARPSQDGDEASPASASIPSLQSGPLTGSYTWASPVPTHARPESDAVKGQPCLMGIDEAGRGPVLGPMVYAVAYAPIAYACELKQIGFADSKALTTERRDHLLQGLIQNPDNLGWAVRVLSPQDISAGMLRRHPYNLNQQALDATVLLIQNVLDSGVDLTEIYVDTLGKAETHARNLKSHFPRHAHIKWTVTSKADAIYPIVGAASIAAKVTRDHILESWIYREPGLGKVLMPLSTDKLGRREGVRGSTVGLLDGATDERAGLDEDVDQFPEGNDGAGKDDGMDLDVVPPSGPSGPAAGAGKRKRTASTKLIELAEVEADLALRRTARKTAQLRAAAAAAVAAQAEDDATPMPELDGLRQSLNPAFANVGSGYPSDPNTVAFLKATLDPVFGWPGIARFSWGTIRTMLEPPASKKKGGSSAASASNRGRGKARGGGVGAGRGRRSQQPSGDADEAAMDGDDDDGQDAANDEHDATHRSSGVAGAGALLITPARHGHAIRWADEQREAASAAITSISKFFAPAVPRRNDGGSDRGEADGVGSGGARTGRAGDEGPLGRATIARLENIDMRKARPPLWRELGLAPVGEAALGL